MNKDYTKEEILKLLEMGEKERFLWMVKNGVRKIFKRIPLDTGYGTETIYESEADCAFRLREKTKYFASYLKQVRQDSDNCDIECWGLHTARPIHWIVAALLAGMEEKK